MSPRRTRPDPNELNHRQRLFVTYILEGETGKSAAIRAGYSEKTAESQASDLLRNPKVARMLESRLRRLESRSELSIRDVIAELETWFLADPIETYNDDGTLKPVTEWPKPHRMALEGYEIEERLELTANDEPVEVRLHKVKLASRKGVAETILRKLGAFKVSLDDKTTRNLADILDSIHQQRGDT